MALNPVIADFYIRYVGVAARPGVMIFVCLKAKSLKTVQKREKHAEGRE